MTRPAVAARSEPSLSRLVLERLMRYYRFLSERKPKQVPDTVTSAEIAAALDIDPTQVRKDFAAIGLLGMGRVGFEVCEICRAIRTELGFDLRHQAVLIGAGHLGSALMAYRNFTRYGLEIVAAFDNSHRRIGRRVAGHTIKSMRALRPFIRRHHIRLAIITAPAEASQQIADRLADTGIEAIWNFSPVHLNVPEHVFVRNEHISLGLSQLAYRLTR